MMNIRWVDGSKFVPGIGSVEKNGVYPVSLELGNLLIKQGQAVKVKSKKR